jgi:hypothetical protein
MAGNVKGEVTLEHGGVTYRMRVDMNALADFEEVSGIENALAALQEDTGLSLMHLARSQNVCDLLRCVDGAIRSLKVRRLLSRLVPAGPTWLPLDSADRLFGVSAEIREAAKDLCMRIANDTGLVPADVENACCLENLVDEQPEIGFDVMRLEQLLG